MSETEKLRSDLDRLGVEYRTCGSAHVTVWDTPTGSASFMEGDVSTVFSHNILGLTAEQAIAATLGSSKSEQGSSWTAEQVREAAKSNSRQYESPVDDGVWITEYDWQAIADELNATLGGGECEDTNERFNAWTCSECKATLLLMFDDYDEPTYSVDGVADVPRFCPNCGKRCVHHG